MNLGRSSDAIASLTKARKLLPAELEIVELLASALLQAGRIQEAYKAFEFHLARSPGNLSDLINLGHLANDLGHHGNAEQHCRQVLRLAPEQAEAVFNLGRALRGLGKIPDAIETFRNVLPLIKDSAAGQSDVGLQFLAMGYQDEAAACFRRAIQLAPDYAQAHSNLGLVLKAQGLPTEALVELRRAIELGPDIAAIYVNLAGLLNSLRQFDEGESLSWKAIKLAPSLADAYCTLADALAGREQFKDSEIAYKKALSLDSGGVSNARQNFGILLQECKRFTEAIDFFRKVKNPDETTLASIYFCSRYICDWSQTEHQEKELKAILNNESVSISPFGFLAMPTADGPAIQKQAGRLHAKKLYQTELAQVPLVASNTHPERDRLRIGYLSANFYNHAVMHLLGGVLNSHDKARFAINLYSYGPEIQDSCQAQAVNSADTFRTIRQLSDIEAAQQIVDDGIDLLIDLTGYTQNSRLGIVALRPAPVIISWLGYSGTLGHERLADYIIGDPVVTPPHHADHFTETLALMPYCYMPYDHSRQIGVRPTRRESGLPEEGFIFCSFNQSYKFNSEVFDIWCKLLKAIPDSILWLHKPSEAAIANLQRETVRRGIEPERLVFADFLSAPEEHLARLQLADLALDTHPYGSHTTGIDALWSGVPLITRVGDTFASRVGASLLQAVGLPELICQDWDAYSQLARALAEDSVKLAAMREKLDSQRLQAPLFDTVGFARDLESLYLKIWSQHGVGRKEIVHANEG